MSLPLCLSVSVPMLSLYFRVRYFCEPVSFVPVSLPLYFCVSMPLWIPFFVSFFVSVTYRCIPVPLSVCPCVNVCQYLRVSVSVCAYSSIIPCIQTSALLASNSFFLCARYGDISHMVKRHDMQGLVESSSSSSSSSTKKGGSSSSSSSRKQEQQEQLQ